MSTTEDTPTVLAANKAAVQRFFSAFNDQAPDVFDEVISPDYVDYGHEPPGRATMIPAGGDDGRAASDRPLATAIYALANGQITETRHEVNLSEQHGG